MGDDWRINGNKQPQQPPMSSGLARYQSAPSSYFASLLNNSVGCLDQICNEIVNGSTPKIDHVFSSYVPDGGSEASLQSQFTATPREEPTPIKSEYVTYVHNQQQLQQQGSGYSSASQLIQQNQSRKSLPSHSLPMSKALDNSYLPEMNTGGSRNTNLIRQNSSPANFFSNFDIDGYDGSKFIGNFGRDTGTNLEPLIRSPNKLKLQLDFPSALPSSTGLMTPISEIENKNMEVSATSLPFSSWDDSDIFPDGFLKGLEDSDGKSFSSINASENQNEEIGKHRPPTMLSHHLSLPKTSAEMSSMEKFLQLQDSVPCRTRAKRGCATHPRSIAERVRRTRISERMRKLQELVPNMDKQTNTSDMLDLAVNYIKDLQDQVKNLSDNRANCTCSNQQTQ